MAIAPYPDAPLCPNAIADHDTELPHGLWDAVRGCHYDHEHGDDPTTPAVAATFPGFNIPQLLGSWIAHANPSSPQENLLKHGGYKWDVVLEHSAGCAGREIAEIGVSALAVLHHAFGNYAVEMLARIHSAVALLRQCRVGAEDDPGFLFASQHQDYGQRVSPYQGNLLFFLDNPFPAYRTDREPYNTIGCVGGQPGTQCGKFADAAAQARADNNSESTWISEPVNNADSGSTLFSLLFRTRDSYQVYDVSEAVSGMVATEAFRYLCSDDGGLTYAGRPGCRYNNSTVQIHEVMGEIPASWANSGLFEVEVDAAGYTRLTGEAFVSRFGDELYPAGACVQPMYNCFKVKLVRAYVGRYGSGFDLTLGEDSRAFDDRNLPEHDIYFCNGIVCDEHDKGAQSSGWIGANN